MKTAKIAVFLMAVLVGSAVAGSADAQHFRHNRHHGGGGVRFGVFIGAPIAAYPRYYYPPAYYPPAYYPYYAPTVVVPSAPVYVEQSVAAPPQNSWYYCRDSQTYYPYVQQCATPWQQVTPQ